MKRLLIAVALALLSACTADAAVTFRSKNESVPATTGTSPTVAEPTGCASGDMAFATYLTTASGAPTLPAGWTSIYNGSSTNTAWRVGYVQRGGSAPSYAFTHTGNIYYEVHVQCYQGAATVTFDAQSTTGAVVTSTTTLPNPTAVVAVAASSLSVAGGFNFGIAGTWVAPAGYTIRSRTTAGTDFVIATKSLAASGSEDPAVFTFSGVPGSADNLWNGFTVTFTDAGGGAVTCAPSLTLLGVGRCG